jgi:hypothetical protein
MKPRDETSPLAGAQADFARKLLRREAGLPELLAGGGEARSAKRSDIHRNNVFAALIETIRGRFPVVERLVGEEFFRAIAYRFASEQPPRSPVLLNYGAAFPDFVAGFEPAGTLPYLADVARLEWLRHAAFHAPDAQPLSPSLLAGIAPEEIGSVKLKLHPSAGVISSEFPVVSIWETNSFDEDVRKIGPETGGETALVLRPGFEVSVIRLGEGGEIFVGAIRRGAALADAAEMALAGKPEFALSQTLGVLLAAGAFCGFAAEDGSHSEGRIE